MRGTKMRRELEAELVELRERTARIARRKANATRDDDGNWHEHEVQHRDDLVVDEIDERSRERIAAIERALDRMRAGQWLRCGRCGTRIESGRLKILPTTDLCARCAAKA
jgi:RNA polymerase-binding transcription factor DksA